MATLAGPSPAISAPARALAAIRAELERLDVTPLTLDDYLREFGYRVTTGYDLRNRTLGELPDIVLTSIRSSAVDLDAAAEAGDAMRATLSEQLVDADRAEFAILVEEARTLYGLRDENGPLTAEWPAGITRHAVLEAGARMLSSGAIDELEHIFDASIDEIIGLLRGQTYPLAAELAMRCNERMGWEVLDAPDRLGPPSEPPPIDIIVTRLTVPTFNAILAMSGGVVTEGGGLLSHTAVIARELGIAAVIGVKGALTRIPDGAEIELDPINGTVTLV